MKHITTVLLVFFLFIIFCKGQEKKQFWLKIMCLLVAIIFKNNNIETRALKGVVKTEAELVKVRTVF
ncbi:MAG: hypothetical protein ABJK28_17620 [Algibacter sp.]